jgi:hypothetical protein
MCQKSGDSRNEGTDPSSQDQRSPKKPKACYRIDAGDCIKCPERECNKKTTPCKFREPSCGGAVGRPKPGRGQTDEQLKEARLTEINLYSLIKAIIKRACGSGMFPWSCSAKPMGDDGMDVPEGISQEEVYDMVSWYMSTQTNPRNLREIKKSYGKQTLNEWYIQVARFIWGLLAGEGIDDTFGGTPTNDSFACSVCCGDRQSPLCTDCSCSDPCSCGGMVRPTGGSQQVTQTLSEADTDFRGWKQKDIEDCCDQEMMAGIDDGDCCEELDNPGGGDDFSIPASWITKLMPKTGWLYEQNISEPCQDILNMVNDPSLYGMTGGSLSNACTKCNAYQNSPQQWNQLTNAHQTLCNMIFANPECCNDDIVNVGTGDEPCNTCCCDETDIGTGRCVNGTQIMVTSAPCECSSRTGSNGIPMIDDPNCNVKPNKPTGDDQAFAGPQFSENLQEIKRFKKLAGIIKN